jgi:hypothetical protein
LVPLEHKGPREVQVLLVLLETQAHKEPLGAQVRWGPLEHKDQQEV